jgi:hypothetical protein
MTLARCLHPSLARCMQVIARRLGMRFIRSIAAKGEYSARGVPWQKMDLTNPKRSRLRCRKTEL